jgi:hypothetical protein
MRGKHYRIKRRVMAILTVEDHKIPTTIPQGATVEVLVEIEGNRLIDVVWAGKTVMMFAIDLHNHGERYEPERAITSG